MYAVIDMETTGLRPGGHDRVVEVAVVQVDARGSAERHWCTLLNPDRDLGPQHVHGIRSAEILSAPTFAQVAGHLTQLLAGRTVVAHNLLFDAAFLVAEYARLGEQVPVHRGTGLCTMQLADQYLPHSGRRLADCCTAAEIDLVDAHTALGDARATAALLAYYLSHVGQPPPWQSVCAAAAHASWPALPVRTVAPVRRAARTERIVEHYLSRLVPRLPKVHDPDADAYLDLLDRALLDRHLSHTEAQALIEFASHLGLGREQAIDLHVGYLEALAVAALDDGVVTDAERADLVKVAALLGFDGNYLDWALETAARRERHTDRRLGQFALTAGDVVVFTGQLYEPRQVWKDRATAARLTPASRVTTATRLVVAADPDTLSRKARKARRHGIPIVDPTTFLRLTRSMAQPGHEGRRGSQPVTHP